MQESVEFADDPFQRGRLPVHVRDFDEKFPLGNLNQSGFMEIWKVTRHTGGYGGTLA